MFGGVLACVLWAGSLRSRAAEPAAALHPRGEIEALLARLETPGCRFKRNGDWHTGSQARAHLTRKWQEMQRRGINTTEDFISGAASRSMRSGEPYLVQCGSAPAQASQDWLLTQLGALRASEK